MSEKPLESIEALSAQIHQVYCQYYYNRHGKEYWTKGDYSLLDEATKDADRFMAKFILEREYFKNSNCIHGMPQGQGCLSCQRENINGI